MLQPCQTLTPSPPSQALHASHASHASRASHRSQRGAGLRRPAVVTLVWGAVLIQRIRRIRRIRVRKQALPWPEESSPILTEMQERAISAALGRDFNFRGLTKEESLEQRQRLRDTADATLTGGMLHSLRREVQIKAAWRFNHRLKDDNWNTWANKEQQKATSRDCLALPVLSRGLCLPPSLIVKHMLMATELQGRSPFQLFRVLEGAMLKGRRLTKDSEAWRAEVEELIDHKLKRPLKPWVLRELVWALENDGEALQVTNRACAQAFEDAVAEHCRGHGLELRTEQQLRSEGSEATPDVLFAEPVRVKGKNLTWLECKCFHASSQNRMILRKLKKQAKRYTQAALMSAAALPLAHERANFKANIEAPEDKPLLSKTPPASLATKAFWSVALIFVSAALINYNKFLMNPSRFPYPVVLVFLHMLSGSLLGCALFLAKPSLFPALSDPDKKVIIDTEFMTFRVLPVGLTFATSLILSNTAYKYASVAFLQMIKQSNVIIVFIFSLMIGLEKYRTNLVVVLLCIMLATGLTVQGELHFSMLGLSVQLCCNFVESAKVVMQGVLLAGAGRKLDPLSFVAVVSPVCCLCLGGLLFVHSYVTPISFLTLPEWSAFHQCGYLLAGNIVVAFLLNVVVANFLKHGSPLSFLLTNLIKDALIVSASSLIFGDPITLQQSIAFILQLFFITLWSLMKSFPDVIEQQGLVKGVTSATAETVDLENLYRPEGALSSFGFRMPELCELETPFQTKNLSYIVEFTNPTSMFDQQFACAEQGILQNYIWMSLLCLLLGPTFFSALRTLHRRQAHNDVSALFFTSAAFFGVRVWLFTVHLLVYSHNGMGLGMLLFVAQFLDFLSTTMAMATLTLFAIKA
ncbi:unnamed protein product [Effrenium voratum]|uniref:Sugar phosphate transporter domain-containing protein n=1 Tax=Effrenium voratum TaxID=2562239 RepID=A0AA36J0B0_9DINO|nr:unnamed protein product [Effrenium voratum]